MRVSAKLGLGLWLALAIGALVLPALATAATPVWSVTSFAGPTNFKPGDDGNLLTFWVTNTGERTAGSCLSVPVGTGKYLDANCTEEATRFEERTFEAFGAIEFEVSLPPGLEATGVEAIDPGRNLAGQSCELEGPATARCTSAGPVIPGDFLRVRLFVNVSTSASGPLDVKAVASGGNAKPGSEDLNVPVTSAPVPFGIAPGSAQVVTSTPRAGAHPSLTTAFDFKQSGVEAPVRSLRDFSLDLPAGLVGNPLAVPRCDMARVLATSCPRSSAVGFATVSISEGITQPVLVYSIQPNPGEPAAFAFSMLFPIRIDTALVRNPAGEYHVRTFITNSTEVAAYNGATVTFWGIPADHNGPGPDQTLITGPGGSTSFGGPGTNPRIPFLTNPTSCGSALSSSLSMRSWPNITQTGEVEPEVEDSATLPFGSFTGCGSLAFEPSLEVKPDSTGAGEATGLGVHVHVPQNENPDSLATAELHSATLTLPPGMVVDSSSGDGLASCTEAQVDLQSNDPAACPPASRLGDVTIETPLLEKPLTGGLYLAAQNANPFHSLLATYLVVEGEGVVIKLPGRVDTDPLTGQITTTFPENPQQPFTDLRVHLNSGSRAPLSNPRTCGANPTVAALAPWSGALVTPISSAYETTGCAAPRFSPQLSAGTQNPLAATFSPFALRLTRSNDEGLLSSLDALQMPSGLLASLRGVPYCPEAAIAAAAGRSGAEELAHPSCPAASKIGSDQAGVGAGAPFYIEAPIYLAGPYKGAPLSLAVITPALAGPFDLGTVVVRAALDVDPETARITVRTDPLPRILQGIPLQIRDLQIAIDRPNFTLNPTSCEPQQIVATVDSIEGQSSTPTQRFQAAECSRLAFKPKLRISLSGQTKRTGNPALKAVLTQPKGENANIARTSVTLPKGEFIDNAHISTPCTRAQFNSTPVPGEGCPASSVLGTAEAWTPLLDAPEEGKVYFRSNGGQRELPDLVIALRGQIPVTLVGFIDSVGGKHAEVTRVRTRFQSVPDAPVSRFVLHLAGGKRGLIENSTSLCRGSHRATLKLTGQNGKRYDSEPAVATSCGKKKAKHAK